MAAQRPEKIVVKTDRGCNPSCCGCHCALPVLLVPALTLSAWVHAVVARQDIARSHNTDSRVREGAGWLSRLAIRFIESYRRRVSGRLGVQCRFEPSCSAYALRGTAAYGFVGGDSATVSRILAVTVNRRPLRILSDSGMSEVDDTVTEARQFLDHRPRRAHDNYSSP